MAAPTRANIGPYEVGEIPAPLQYTFLDSFNNPIDLSTFTAKFSYREASAAMGTAVLANATVTNGPAGQVTYTWTGAEFATAGHYLTEFWVGNGTNRFASISIEFDVKIPVGQVPTI